MHRMAQAQVSNAYHELAEALVDQAATGQVAIQSKAKPPSGLQSLRQRRYQPLLEARVRMRTLYQACHAGAVTTIAIPWDKQTSSYNQTINVTNPDKHDC